MPTGDTAARGSFRDTRWSLVARVGAADEAAARAALGELAEDYWWPLYAYLRRRGEGADRAADLVQGFFARLLEKRDLSGAERERGRFRAYVLGALRHYLAHEREHERAEKRGGGALPLALDPGAADRRWRIASARELDPERTFERAWALETIERALARLERGYAAAGKAEVFEALRPHLVAADEARPFGELAARLSTTEGALKVAAHRMRAAFRETLRGEVGATLGPGERIDDELAELLRALQS